MNYLENVFQKIYMLIESVKSIKNQIYNTCTKSQSGINGKKIQYLAQRVDGKKIPIDRKL